MRDKKYRPTQHFYSGLRVTGLKNMGWGLFSILNKYLLSLAKFINSSCMYPYAAYSQIIRSCWLKADKMKKELIFNICLYMSGKCKLLISSSFYLTDLTSLDYGL